MQLCVIKLLTLLSLVLSFGNCLDDWWRNAVIYQLVPQSFKDSNGDGIGDLKGIRDKLNYFKELHVDAICLSPIFASPMVNFGYDIADFTKINPTLGTMEDFEVLISEANKKGIKIILDIVPNHTSDKHNWFSKSIKREDPYTDYYKWVSGIPKNHSLSDFPNDWLSVIGDSAWTWSEERGQYYLHHFTSAEPELNYNNPAVLKEIQQVFHFWLTKGVFGFRVYLVSFLADPQDISEDDGMDLPLTYTVVAQWREYLDNYSRMKDNVSRLLIVESHPTSDLSDALKYYGDNGIPGAHISMNLELIKKLKYSLTASEMADVIEAYMTNIHGERVPNWMVGTADTHRVATHFNEELVDAFNMLIMILPGISISYYGEEIGMQDTYVKWDQTHDPLARSAGFRYYFENSRDPMRSPFQWDGTTNAGFSTNKKTWLPVNYNYKEINVKSEGTAGNSHYKLYKKLTQVRHTPTIQQGGTEIDVVNNLFIVFRNLDGHDKYIAILNFGSNEETLDLMKYRGSNDVIKVYAASFKSDFAKSTEIKNDTIILKPNNAVLLQVQQQEIVRERFYVEDEVVQADQAQETEDNGEKIVDENNEDEGNENDEVTEDDKEVNEDGNSDDEDGTDDKEENTTDSTEVNKNSNGTANNNDNDDADMDNLGIGDEENIELDDKDDAYTEEPLSTSM